jgi:class 3 adenylate cyclase
MGRAGETSKRAGMGGVPIEALVGIGFLDIAEYTHLSRFLSPAENQALLNGIFTAFDQVLRSRGGYLNKIQGDSMMFHFGGPLDSAMEGLDEAAQAERIANGLFFACVEMQRVCLLYDEADEGFLKLARSPDAANTMRRGFEIIQALRSDPVISPSINAFYHVRVRIGASLGLVSVGLYGPSGSQRWDVIGVPVIQAKRMESSAPAGGIRISQELYAILEAKGSAEAYLTAFRKEAAALRGRCGDISHEELFKSARVRMREKSSTEFDSYSVQADPLLPERVIAQARLLLERGEEGIERIIATLQYYRGNARVIGALEALFAAKGIQVNRGGLLRLLDPKLYRALVEASGGDLEEADRRVAREFSFQSLFERLGRIQDAVRDDPRIVNKTRPFSDQVA